MPIGRPSIPVAGVLLPTLLVAACGGDTSESRPRDAGLSPIYYPSRLVETAPEKFRARFETSSGTFVVEVHRAWSPNGADRFYNLVKNGYYDDTRVYRVVDGFMAQFGIHGDPTVHYQWRNSIIPDDPVLQSNTRGRVTFATSGPNSRINEVFVNLVDNPSLDERGFSPIGEVVEGMEAVDAFYSEYGDGPPRGGGPYQARARAQGNAYLDAEFPELTRIVRAWVEGEG